MILPDGMAEYGEVETNEWISIDDEMPKIGEWYLVVSNCNMPRKKVVTMAFLDRALSDDTLIEPVWLTHNDSYLGVNGQNDEWESVTHWMPLPEAPEQ